jgi:hypothetical protein
MQYKLQLLENLLLLAKKDLLKPLPLLEDFLAINIAHISAIEID